MNKRLKKKSEKMRRKALHRILDLALDINGMQASDREFTGDHPTAFVDFYGNVGMFELRVYEKGWDKENLRDGMFECSICDNKYEDTPMQMDSKLKKYKEKLIKDGIL